jgi:hypothetical protein
MNYVHPREFEYPRPAGGEGKGEGDAAQRL